jgi:hypothetical protein
MNSKKFNPEVLTKFILSEKAPNSVILEQAKKVAEFVRHKSLAYWTFYTFVTHKFKKPYTETEIISLLKKETGLEVIFCNGLKGTTSEVTLGYEAYEGLISLMPEDDHESFYNPPTDFIDDLEKYKKEVLILWKALRKL